MCFGISWLYTRFFWDRTFPHLLFSVSCVWIFGILLIGLVLLGGILCTAASGSVLFTGLLLLLMLFGNLLPRFQKYNPLLLVTSNMELLSEALVPRDFFWSMGITVFLTILALVSAIFIFNRRRL